MLSLLDQRSHLRSIDTKILDLLEERALLKSDMSEDGGQVENGEDLQWWVEEAAERGLDNDLAMEKIYRAIVSA